MDDEARAPPGLDPAPRREPRSGPWRGRRWPPRHARHDEGVDRPRIAYAALDLGTNNCRLLVARPMREGFRVIDAFSRIIRLGEGMAASGLLSEPAIERALEALSICRDKMNQRGVPAARARLIATEACRSAENGGAFRERVKREVGLELEIVDRETEAALAAIGCTPLMDPCCEGVILFDIGGGSSEIVRLGRSRPAAGGPPEPTIRGWASLPIGVVTLAERYGGVEVSRALFEAMTAEVEAHVRRFAAERCADIRLDAMHLLGTSGTVTTIAGLHLRLKRYDRRQVDGCWMTDTEITGVLDELLDMDYAARVASPCIGSERADLVLAGCAILEAIRRVFPCTRLRVADRGLREGILIGLMRADGVWQEAAP